MDFHIDINVPGLVMLGLFYPTGCPFGTFSGIGCSLKGAGVRTPERPMFVLINSLIKGSEGNGKQDYAGCVHNRGHGGFCHIDRLAQ